MNSIQHFPDGEPFTIVKVFDPTEHHPDCGVINSDTGQRCQLKADGVLRFDESAKEIAICEVCLDKEVRRDR